MVAKTRQRCIEERPEAALKDRPRPEGPSAQVNGKTSTHVIAIACSEAPEGHAHCGPCDYCRTRWWSWVMRPRQP